LALLMFRANLRCDFGLYGSMREDIERPDGLILHATPMI
jgi:hypothetical protein